MLCFLIIPCDGSLALTIARRLVQHRLRVGSPQGITRKTKQRHHPPPFNRSSVLEFWLFGGGRCRCFVFLVIPCGTTYQIRWWRQQGPRQWRRLRWLRQLRQKGLRQRPSEPYGGVRGAAHHQVLMRCSLEWSLPVSGSSLCLTTSGNLYSQTSVSMEAMAPFHSKHCASLLGLRLGSNVEPEPSWHRTAARIHTTSNFRVVRVWAARHVQRINLHGCEQVCDEKPSGIELRLSEVASTPNLGGLRACRSDESLRCKST